MTFIMLIMVHLCVSVKHKTEIIKAKEQKFSGNPCILTSMHDFNIEPCHEKTFSFEHVKTKTHS